MFPRLAGMNGASAQPELSELAHLIVHQRNEWTDDEGGPAASQSWQLITQRLSRARGHDEQRVFPALERLTHLFLVGSKRLMPKHALQEFAQRRGVCLMRGRGSHGHGSKRPDCSTQSRSRWNCGAIGSVSRRARSNG